MYNEQFISVKTNARFSLDYCLNPESSLHLSIASIPNFVFITTYTLVINDACFTTFSSALTGRLKFGGYGQTRKLVVYTDDCWAGCALWFTQDKCFCHGLFSLSKQCAQLGCTVHQMLWLVAYYTVITLLFVTYVCEEDFNLKLCPVSPLPPSKHHCQGGLKHVLKRSCL